MDTAEVIDRYYDAVNNGDWETWIGFFADDVVIDEPGNGHAEGIAALRGAIGAATAGYSSLAMDPEQVLVQGNEAAVFWRCQAADADGVAFDARGADYFRLRDGKIAYMRNLGDSVPFRPGTGR